MQNVSNLDTSQEFWIKLATKYILAFSDYVPLAHWDHSDKNQAVFQGHYESKTQTSIHRLVYPLATCVNSVHTKN